MSADEAFAKEIAKQLPVKDAYADAVQPAAKQTGQLAADLVKAIQLALAPVQLLAGLQDRFRRFVETSVARIPEQNRVAPPPQIIGPILEGVRYEPEGTAIDQMFSELLSAAMDSHRLNDAHPAFPSIIRQLSPDEAKMLTVLADKHEIKRVLKFHLSGGLGHTTIESDDMSTACELQFPENLEIYHEHLGKLGLISFDAIAPTKPIIENGTQTGGRNFLRYKLTDFGASFMRASRPQKTNEQFKG